MAPTATPPAGQLARVILKTLIDVSNTKGSRAKERKIKDMTSTLNGVKDGGLEAFKRLLKYTVDGFYRYGISFPQGLQHSPAGVRDLDDPVIWETLDALRAQVGQGSLAAKTASLVDLLHTLTKDTFDLVQVIIEKDLGCGISTKAVNTLFPGLLSEFSCMLAHKFEAKRLDTFPLRIEPKWDGMRILTECPANADNRVATSFSRTGREQSSMTSLHQNVLQLVFVLRSIVPEHLKDLPVWIDGEIISGSFNESISEARGDAPMEQGTLKVFDVIFGDLVNASDGALTVANGTYEDRRALLEKAFIMAKENNGRFGNDQLSVELTPSYWVSSVPEVFGYFARLRAAGYEGLIAKKPDGLYMRKRSPSWMKIKAEETADLKVKGAFEGVGKYTGMLGGLIVDFNGVDVSVGSGFSDAQRADFWRQYQEDLAKIAADDRDNCQIVDSLCEVQYQEVTPDGSLRHPVFAKLRRDKVEVSF